MANVAELAAAVEVEGLPQAQAGLSAFGRSVDAAGKAQGGAADQSAKHDAALRKVGTGALVMGGLITAGVGLAVMTTAEFDKALSGVAAVSNATSGEMSKLRQAAIDAGQATSFSASDAARAEAELAKAGVSVADILGGGLRGALDLAAAGQLDLSEAATITAQALNIFNLGGDKASHVADVLAAGANKSAADVGQLGDALRQGGLLAKQTGLDLEDTVGVLALFADNALIGSDAGTSLKTMLQRLTPQSAEAQAEMTRLGISAYDAQGNFIGLEKFAGNLRDSMKNLTPEARNAAMGVIFGSDAVRAANIIYEAGEQGIRRYIRAVDDQGAAGRMAAKQMDNLSGDIEQFKGSLETSLIQGGSGATSVLRFLAQGATEAVNAFSSLPSEVQTAAFALVAFSGIGLVAVGAGIKLVEKVKETSDALRTLASASGLLKEGSGLVEWLSAVRVGLGGAGAAAGSFAVMFAGVAAVSYAIVEALGLGEIELDRWQRAGRASAKAAVADARESGNAYKALSDEYHNTGVVLDDFTYKAKSLGAEINARTDDVDAMRSVLARAGGEAAKSGTMFAELRQKYDDIGAVLDRLRPKYEEQRKKLQENAAEAQVHAMTFGVVIPDGYSKAEQGAEDFDKAIENSVRSFGSAATTAALSAGLTGDAIDGLATHAAAMDQATANVLAGFTSVVGKFGDATEVGKGQVLDFVTTTTAQTAQWASDVQALAAAGVDGGLLDQLRQAGPKSQALVTTLLGMVADGSIGAVNQAYAAVTDITATLNAALDGAAIATAIRTMEQMTVAKAAYADLQEGGVRNLTALADSSDANVRRSAFEFIQRINEMQGSVDGMHGKNVDIGANDWASAVVAQLQARVDALRDKTINITARYNVESAGILAPGQGVFDPTAGARGLVGLARGGSAGMLVGPNQPVLIGEGLSREAVVPYDNFGDMVATIRNTGRAGDFARAALAAGGGGGYGSGGGVAGTAPYVIQVVLDRKVLAEALVDPVSVGIQRNQRSGRRDLGVRRR